MAPWIARLSHQVQFDGTRDGCAVPLLEADEATDGKITPNSPPNARLLLQPSGLCWLNDSKNN